LSSTEPERPAEPPSLHRTDLRLGPPPVAPIPGLFDDGLDTAARAYLRRAPFLAGAAGTLRSLRPIDHRLEQMTAAARYYGDQALDAARAHFEQAPAAQQHAFAFAWLSCALEQDRPQQALWRILDRVDPVHDVALRDAIWFFPRSPRTDLLQGLIRSADRRWGPLGIELAGLLAQPRLLSGLDDGAPGRPADAVHLAKARAGLCEANFDQHSNELLSSGDSSCHAAVLAIAASGRMAAADGVRRLAEPLLNAAPMPAAAPAAVALDALSLLAIWHPRQTLDRVLSSRPEPDDAALTVVALVGYLDGLLWMLRSVAQRSEAPSRLELDVVQALLGQVPASLRQRPGVAEQRQADLRALLFERLRAWGCDDVQPEPLLSDDAAVLKQAWPVVDVRLRWGRPWQAVHAMSGAADVSHRLRRWLYREWAFQHSTSLALHEADIAQRQFQAIEAADFFGELAHSQ